ncbi:entericidin EcnA/B family protein [Marivita sp.]|nr:entericidin EcnA/B family protein [Marivita sp.]
MRAWALVILVAGALGACATVDGIGQDISTTSRTVQGWF